MGKHSPVAIAPKYMQSFACIGTSCEENCCHGWQVTINKPTYKKYREVSIVDLRDKLKDKMVITDNSTSTDNYAHIKLDEKGFCPFLDEKSLCEIQGKLGADYLSKTCQTYPRIYNRVNDRVELYASLSCPEATRQLLKSDDAMQYVEIDLPFPNLNAVPVGSTYVVGEKTKDLFSQLSPYINETAQFILRFPQFNASDAMIVLSIMMQGINEAIRNLNVEDARIAIIDRLINFNNTEYLIQAGTLAKNIMVDRSKQMFLLRGMFHIYLSNHYPRSSFRQTIDDAMQGIQFDENNLEASEAHYREADEKWFTPFNEAHPYLLSNYLLNDIGKNKFPVGFRRDLESEFLDMAIRYSLIKLNLIGIAGLKKRAFCEADYVRVIYTFSRNIEHNKTFMPSLLKHLDEDGLKSFAAATVMMR